MRMTRLYPFVWIVILAACGPSASTPSPLPGPRADGLTRTSGEVCFRPPYADDIGIRDGGRAQVLDWNFGLDVQSDPYQSEPGNHLNPGERVTILEGPFCERLVSTSNHGYDLRMWRVRSETREVDGWIPEYVHDYGFGIRFNVAPLEGDDPGIVAGTPLAAPVRFGGRLLWTGIGGPIEPRRIEHTVTFDDYGYITIALETGLAELTDPDLHSGVTACRVLVQIRPYIGDVVVFGTEIQVNSHSIDRLWVQPREYSFVVDLRYIPGGGATPAASAHPVCPDAVYTLTIESALPTG